MWPVLGFCAVLIGVPALRGSLVAREQPLDIAVEDDAGPWSLKDGNGQANEEVLAAFKAVNVEVRLRVLPYARCKAMAVQGSVVACFSMSRAPELASSIAFSEKPLFVCQSDYYQSVARPVRAESPGRLRRGTVVGVVLGYEYPESLYRLQKEGILVLDDAASEEINLRKLADGRIDLALVNVNESKPAEYLTAKAGVSDKVSRAFHAGILPSFIGFSRKHPRGAEALARFNEGMRVISADGTLDRIEKRWVARVSAETEALRAKARAGGRGDG